jgi:hypothetical protein
MTWAYAVTTKVVSMMKMNCFAGLPPAFSVRLPVRVTAAVGKVYTPESRVRPPRFDDDSSSVGASDRALD